ncbi:hypothetical protein PFICI_08417 [Pestalotiopsis fici W106-1]|uniref:Xylose isomerase-like TIM barrel domain-containing protein n=1 Tax=Pestalotiopsis fici (strain W106-1 / CGMCC3.15140) TaxID=1229662 RepID=W3X422_PESFW|nr:uncharacterized protein PFICI_08417 [Pestalotiopsis fici W106-1]ETS80888.1 hypothetical protein PFICI_08417 [Pestalotiopsis fici W106-1]
MISNKLAIGTHSLGQHDSHSLDQKIKSAARHGFSGVEVVYGDLETYAQACGIALTAAAKAIRQLCLEHNVAIISLAPFENFEGDKSPLRQRLSKAQHWLDIARTLGAEYLQVPAQFTVDCDGDEDVIASDLQQLSDLGSAKQPVISIAYEPMSWSTHVSTWQTTLRIIKKVDRANFGLCLDSFHILTKIWGNNRDASGKYPNADARLATSLASFKRDFPLEKLFYVQMSDGERFDPPFSREHPWFLEGEAAEFTWSKHARPFPGEKDYGAYLPVGEFLKACVVEKKFRGWVSMEIFDRRMRDGQYSIEDAAMRAKRSWEYLLRQVSPPQKL